MTIDDLVKSYNAGSKVLNERAWVTAPGFSSLYARVGPRYLQGVEVHCIQLATINAESPGSGAFTELVSYLRETYPRYPVFVENVLDPRFADKLLRLGFLSIPDLTPPSFVMI